MFEVLSSGMLETPDPNPNRYLSSLSFRDASAEPKIIHFQDHAQVLTKTSDLGII